MHLAAIELNPELITAGLSLLWGLFSSLRARDYRQASETLVDGIEYAARNETNPKKAVKMMAAGAIARTINKILREKNLRKE